MSDLGKTHLCNGLCLSVFMSIGFPFDFYCRKIIIFLEPGVSQTKSVIIFDGASAILQIVELNLKKMVRFCSAVFSPNNHKLLFHNFVHGFDFQFSRVQAGVCLSTGSRKAEFLCVPQTNIKA